MPSSTRIIVILCLISSLGRFVLDSYLPSLPAIAQYFNLSTANSEYTLTYYLIGFSLSQLIYGPLSDCYGRKKILLIGLTIFGIGNFICAFSSSINILFAARFLAGAGAGSCGVLNRAIASDHFKGVEFSKVWSYTTSSLVITLCLAPILGGYIQQLNGWRMNFFLSSFYILAVLLIVMLCFREKKLVSTVENDQKKSMQFNQILRNYYFILTTKSFITSTLCYALAFSGLIVYFQLSPLILIDKLHLSPAQYGWSSMLIAFIYLIGGNIVNYLVPRCGTKALITLGSLLLISGGVLLLAASLLHFQTTLSILIPSSIYILGARIIIPNAVANSMENLRHLGGSSSAMMGCIQMLGSAFISYYVGSFNNANLNLLGYVFTLLGLSTLTFCLYSYLKTK